MSHYQPPVLLAARPQLAGFRCRSEEQCTWLVEVAKQAHGTVTNRVFLVTLVDQTAVVACYAWFMASVAIADLPARLRRGASPYPQPVALLVRPAAGCDQPGRLPQRGQPQRRPRLPRLAGLCRTPELQGPGCGITQSAPVTLPVKTERVGFEPTEGFPSNDFESFAFDHSATSPSPWRRFPDGFREVIAVDRSHCKDRRDHQP